MKLCKDCRHIAYSKRFCDYICKHESAVKSVNPVDGEVMYQLADQSRKCHTLCDKDAVHFQPKRSFIQWLKEVV